jgi:predicted dehydrogenase
MTDSTNAVIDAESILQQAAAEREEAPEAAPPRLGFLGVGWIGRHRMEKVLASGMGEVVAIADSSPDVLAAARERAPAADVVDSLDALLALPLDGIVIATPSALHAEQSIAALERGIAVFCQKPLGRTAHETRQVVDAAQRADRLLGVDLSYRFTTAFRELRGIVDSGGIGTVFAADVVFHNAYGPDKPWFYDPALSGGGCLMDLGVHLVDAALWILDFPDVDRVDGRLYAKGRPLAMATVVEDYAVATLDLAGDTVVRLACSWNLPAGQDAVIEATFYGTEGGASVRNVGGSFYDFALDRFSGTRSERLVSPPDDWGGRAAVEWATRLRHGGGFDPETHRFVAVSEVLDRIYGR